ncbi:hypothetical protein VSDG_05860 [Cytospora chrysosperma]|uniref:DASH complex subunit DAD1 n=1 Tax=Cytospora chrysosperma TaxID=252740 RepID=A0A423VVV3_CYTCH|nr:hypothetical protein VSDG_05860 [Valsa sordida]
MASSSRAYFEQQRESLIGEIAMSFEHVLANINKLNRNLEAVIAVGNEFSSVEALWSTFENVMGKEEGEGKDDEDNDNGGNNNNKTEAEGAQAKVEEDHHDDDDDDEEEEEEHRVVDGDGDVEMG